MYENGWNWMTADENIHGATIIFDANLRSKVVVGESVFDSSLKMVELCCV